MLISLGPVRLAVLSTLPLTEVQNENYFLHLDFLLALAESIDAVFSGLSARRSIPLPTFTLPSTERPTDHRTCPHQRSKA